MSTQASLAFVLTFLGTEHTHEQQALIKPDPQGLYSNNWEADPTPDRSVTATHQRGPTQLPDKAIVTTTPATLLIKRITASIPFGCMPVMTCKQCLHPKYWTHTVCTGMVAHKNSPSGPQQLTVSPEFTETEKFEKSKSEGTISN